MTDNEITKALECCSSNATGNEYCKDCPYNFTEYCGEESAKDILDLINRQQAEIEELRNIVKADLLTAKEDFKLSISDISKIRAEAIKEFESKVIEMAYIDDYFDLVVNVASIEAIAKEMVGDDK